ncbi:hypothetical protein HPB51_005906 [Rhipicephalus microplus]|uniref:Transmembrane protein n=1 Tax=Rhipicephalus microplus TaxID=6941 RepID=A0A9J6D456_RHIMP|nr:hypothetical protein HPB51_005906 [Rhipicephalus microplus]
MAAKATDSLTTLLPRRSPDLWLHGGWSNPISALCVCALATGLASAAAICVLAQKNRSLETGYSVSAGGGDGTAIVFPAAFRRLFEQPTRPAPPVGTSSSRGPDERLTQDAPHLVDRNERWKLVRVTRRRRSSRTYFDSASVPAFLWSLSPAVIPTVSAILPGSTNGTRAESQVSGPQRPATVEGKQHDTNASAEVGRPSLDGAAPNVPAVVDLVPELRTSEDYRAKNGTEVTAQVTQFSTSMASSVVSEEPVASLVSDPLKVPSGDQKKSPRSPTTKGQ